MEGKLEGTPMSEIIKLPSGATAKIKDATTLRVKDRKRVFAAANGQEGIMQALSLTDGLIACLVEEWSFDLLPPAIKIESLDELEMADYDALAEYAQKAQEVIFPSIAKTLETEADPKADTADSKD
jgi:hypothetical protein